MTQPPSNALKTAIDSTSKFSPPSLSVESSQAIGSIEIFRTCWSRTRWNRSWLQDLEATVISSCRVGQKKKCFQGGKSVESQTKKLPLFNHLCCLWRAVRGRDQKHSHPTRVQIIPALVDRPSSRPPFITWHGWLSLQAAVGSTELRYAFVLLYMDVLTSVVPHYHCISIN